MTCSNPVHHLPTSSGSVNIPSDYAPTPSSAVETELYKELEITIQEILAKECNYTYLVISKPELEHIKNPSLIAVATLVSVDLMKMVSGF